MSFEILMPFEQWWEIFKRVAVTDYGWSPTITVHPEDWLPYYQEGFSPKDAIEEDAMHA